MIEILGHSVIQQLIYIYHILFHLDEEAELSGPVQDLHGCGGGYGVPVGKGCGARRSCHKELHVSQHI